MPRRTASRCPPRGTEADYRDPNAYEQLVTGEVFYGPPILVTSFDWKRAAELWHDELLQAKRKTRSRLYVEKHLKITIERNQS